MATNLTVARALWPALCAVTFAFFPVAACASDDPLNSVNWSDMKEQFFEGAPYVFDDRVKVVLPMVVENQAQVPITADARELRDVRKIVVFADLNPVQHVLTLTPLKAAPFVSFRMKVEQATPVRAAALTSDGVWHVGGAYLDAAGGGCSTPALARNEQDWSIAVGNSRGRVWRHADGTSRARVTIKHPMDTGLTPDNIPAFYIETLRLRSETGEVLAKLELREPMSEDPTLTFQVNLPAHDKELHIEGRDIGGNEYSSKIPAGWKQSQVVNPSFESATR